jgi:hypothetical protein
VVTIENAKGEITTYAYGDGNAAPLGYLASITTSPVFNNSRCWELRLYRSRSSTTMPGNS